MKIAATTMGRDPPTSLILKRRKNTQTNTSILEISSYEEDEGHQLLLSNYTLESASGKKIVRRPGPDIVLPNNTYVTVTDFA